MMTQPERALARAVGPHQRVRLAAADRQVDAAQDRLAFDGDVQVVDFQCLSHRYSSNASICLLKHPFAINCELDISR